MLLTTALALMLAAPLLACAIQTDNAPLVLDLWPGNTPNDSGLGEYGPIAPERVRDPADAPTKTATWITGVTHPTLTVFRPPKANNTGAAFIVCPGGGYWNLAWDLEGTEVAEWLRSKGITGIVLKYRVPRRAGEPEPLPAPGPLLDAQRAVRLVRSKAREWKIDPNRIGIGGFSAGGHLALATATNFDRRLYEPLDAIDKLSCRPDFAVAAYPGYLVDLKTWELQPSIRIPAGTPPVFLVHAFGDKEPGASAAHSAVMFLALKKAGVPTELHIYAAGDHGFGVRKSSLPVSTWGERCLDWLRSLGMLTPRN
jgi:acetyl esterase/lipase